MEGRKWKVEGGRWKAPLLSVFCFLLSVTFILDWGPGALRLAREWLAGPRQDMWQQVHDEGTIRFGVDSNDWPFAAVDGQGQYMGLNVDLGRRLAEAMGVQAQFVPVGYDGAYDALRMKQCDALIGALENDPARVAEFIYTGAYFDAGQVVLRTQMNADCTDSKNSSVFVRVNPCTDLGGQRIAVELGSEADAAARQIARRTPGVTLIERDSAELALEAVASGAADAAIADAVWARQAVAKRPEFSILPGSVQPYPLAIAVRADSPRLQTALNRALMKLEADGALDTILARWLDR